MPQDSDAHADAQQSRNDEDPLRLALDPADFMYSSVYGAGCDSQMDSRYATVSKPMARTNCSKQSRVLLRLDNAFRFIDGMTVLVGGPGGRESGCGD